MKARSFQPLILAAIVLIGASCRDSHPASGGQPTAVAEPCSPPPQQPLVFYESDTIPARLVPILSGPEMTRIVDTVASQTKEPIWLIRVRPSTDRADRTLIAYLAPQKQTPRIREGHAYRVWFYKGKTGIESRGEYFQVSKPHETFAKQFTLPTVDELPFFPPSVVDPNSEQESPMADEEAIRIADFVREPSTYESLPSPEKETMLRQIRELPLLGIRRRADTIEVEWGIWMGPLYGWGLTLTLERAPTGYKIVKWGDWIS